jgi:hypothetical protein
MSNAAALYLQCHRETMIADSAINRILMHPLITRATANNTRGIYRVQIGTLKTEIQIMLVPSTLKRGWFEFRISHTIKTPLQAVAYHPKVTADSSRANALRRALYKILAYYRAATKKGHQPGEDWLVWPVW